MRQSRVTFPRDLRRRSDRRGAGLLSVDFDAGANRRNVPDITGQVMPGRYAEDFREARKTAEMPYFIGDFCFWCRWRDSNPHDFLQSRDFKSRASAISPHRQYLIANDLHHTNQPYLDAAKLFGRWQTPNCWCPNRQASSNPTSIPLSLAYSFRHSARDIQFKRHAS
jgi:hypothetical protein